MSKKKRQITNLQFNLGIVVVIILILGLFYFVFTQERFAVKEDVIKEKPLIEEHLNYNTEFCANRLTDLVQEVHFLQKEISGEQNILGEEELVQDQETKVIKIEQRELQEVNAEFETYKSMCDQFDITPTVELCVTFLQEAKDQYDVAQASADNTSGVEHLEILIKELRKNKRIYEGLKGVCAEIE